MQPRGVGGSTTRGQTGLDYLVGIGLFLLTAGFVLAFVPGTLAPFEQSAERPLVADRASDTFMAGLAEGAEPNVLNTTCTLAFFGVGSSECDVFDSSETTTDAGLAAELGMPPFTRVNVTLERSESGTVGRAPLCGNATSMTVQDCTLGGNRLASGPAVPTEDSVVTATRTVVVDGRDAVVVVRVW